MSTLLRPLADIGGCLECTGLFYNDIHGYSSFINSYPVVYNYYFKYIHSNHTLQLKRCTMNNKVINIY